MIYHDVLRALHGRLKLFDHLVLLQQHRHKDCFDGSSVGDECAGRQMEFRRAPHFVEQHLIFFSQRPSEFTPCFSVPVDEEREGIVVASHDDNLLSSMLCNSCSVPSSRMAKSDK